MSDWHRPGRADRHQIEQLVAKIQPNDSMVEIHRYLREILGAEGADGHTAVAIDGAENVILWGGLSSEAVEILAAVMKDDRIVMTSADVVRYGVAGRGLDLPILPPPPYDPLEREYWLPIVFYPARHAPRLPVVDLTEHGR
jgi:hypothetical protein